MKSLGAITLIVVLAVILLGIMPSLKGPETSGAVSAQDLSHTIYLPLVMKDYADVRLESHTAFYYIAARDETEAECLAAVGELKNYGDTIYDPGSIVINFRKTDGELVAQCDTYPFAYTLGPGDVTAFRCELCDPPTCPDCDIPPSPSEWSYYTVEFSPYETSIRPANLAVSTVSLEETSDGLIVEVEITNRESEPVCMLSTWITLYDEDRNVLNADITFAPPFAWLDSGGTAYTSVRVYGPIFGYTDYMPGAYASGP